MHMGGRKKDHESELALRGSSSQVGKEELERPQSQERNKPEGTRGSEWARPGSVSQALCDFITGDFGERMVEGP